MAEEPLINLQLSATGDLTMLERAIRFARINYIRYGRKTPLLRVGRANKSSTIFDYSATYSRSGLAADGDLTPEDVAELDQVNREARLDALERLANDRSFEVTSAVNQDAGSQVALGVANRAAVIKTLSGQYDKTLDDYFKYLGVKSIEELAISPTTRRTALCSPLSKLAADDRKSMKPSLLCPNEPSSFKFRYHSSGKSQGDIGCYGSRRN